MTAEWEELVDPTLNDSLPTAPKKLNREEQKRGQAFEKEFTKALRVSVKGTPWKYAYGWLFREIDGWFVSNMPLLTSMQSVVNHMSYKPMSLDSLFWEIQGLEANEHEPLSLRANGAWVLHPRQIKRELVIDETDPQTLATACVDWSTDWCNKVIPNISLDTLLTYGGDRPDELGRSWALAFCIHVLKGDYTRAYDMLSAGIEPSRAAPPSRNADTKIFVTAINPMAQSFAKRAKEWLESRTRH